MALYYLQSRGLPPGEAKKLMLQAFVAGVFDGAEDEAALQDLALAKLGELVCAMCESILPGTGRWQPERLTEGARALSHRPEEQTSELQSLMRISYAVFCLNKEHLHIPT